MASTQTWSEYNGAGSTETASRAEVNWKNIDDSTTAYTASPITVPAAGTQYSFAKVQALKFAGTWNSLSALTYKVSTAAPGTGVALNADVVTSYTQPVATIQPASAASTTGTAANFSSSTTPFTAGTTSTTAGGTMYANAYRTQLAVGTTAGPGDITSVTVTASWTES
ncbi:MAG: hypothetical protein QFB87_04565 [Patescibacteria group bacterium]|nr:hypothetical protein [Patescibacteria group bacterium]